MRVIVFYIKVKYDIITLDEYFFIIYSLKSLS
nr:MAG TPA: hypothetical protein [Caudoviricetes sp.]DAX33240.1 MAG TPA: hypothetical protein [Caudoviricetes sp.]